MDGRSNRSLLAAGAVAIVAIGLVVVYGITPLPGAPGLYGDGGPAIEGTVAYTEIETERARLGERGGCLFLLDLATGDVQKIKCTPSLWLSRWDASGYLVMNANTPAGPEVLVDPFTGEIVRGTPEPRSDPEVLYTYRASGRISLVYDDGVEQRVLLDEAAPEEYRFIDTGISGDGLWAWVVDGSDRLLVLPVEGGSGPWLVATNVAYAAWR
jgi:hypothetical protein